MVAQGMHLLRVHFHNWNMPQSPDGRDLPDGTSRNDDKAPSYSDSKGVVVVAMNDSASVHGTKFSC